MAVDKDWHWNWQLVIHIQTSQKVWCSKEIKSIAYCSLYPTSFIQSNNPTIVQLCNLTIFTILQTLQSYNTTIQFGTSTTMTKGNTNISSALSLGILQWWGKVFFFFFLVLVLILILGGGGSFFVIFWGNWFWTCVISVEDVVAIRYSRGLGVVFPAYWFVGSCALVSIMTCVLRRSKRLRCRMVSVRRWCGGVLGCPWLFVQASLCKCFTHWEMPPEVMLVLDQEAHQTFSGRQSVVFSPVLVFSTWCIRCRIHCWLWSWRICCHRIGSHNRNRNRNRNPCGS